MKTKYTVSQVAAKLNVNPYTIKRWYEFYQDLDAEEIETLHKEGMPLLPEYEVFGNRGDRVWDETDIGVLESFKDWVPPTRRGIFKKYKEEKE